MKGLVWKEATLTASTTSAEVDLGMPFRSLAVYLPAITSTANMKIHVAMAAGGTYHELHHVQDDGSVTEVDLNVGTGSMVVVIPNFGFQHLRVELASQTVTVYVAGFDG